MFQTLRQKLEIRRQKKAQAIARPKPPTKDAMREAFNGFFRMDPLKQHLDFFSPLEKTHIIFKIRRGSVKITALQAFYAIYPDSLISFVFDWNFKNNEQLKFSDGSSIAMNLKKYKMYLSYRIYLQSLDHSHRATKTKISSKQTIRDNWKKAKDALDGDKKGLGIDQLEKIHSTYYIPSELEHRFNYNFISIISEGPEHVAGDEKAFGGYHQAKNSKKCDHKVSADKIALWFQTVAGRTATGHPFVIRFRQFVHDSLQQV